VQRNRHRWTISVVASALTAIASPVAAQVVQRTAPFARVDPPVLSETIASKVLVVETAALAFNGAVIAEAPMVEAGALVFNGAVIAEMPVVETGALVFNGAVVAATPVIETAAMIFNGAVIAEMPVVETAALVFSGVTEMTAPPSRLAYIDVPTEPRQSTYLSLSSASVAVDQALRLSYAGLPAQPGIIGLLYVGAAAPRLLAWSSTRPDRPEGVFERGASSLPPFTGPWKACIGFRSDLRAPTGNPADYADCLDFVLAGPGSIGARPVVSFPGDEFRARRNITLSYSGMPPANCSIALVRTGETRAVTRHMTGRRASGTWVFRVDAPGSYEMLITYSGDAVRARMPLEITQ